MTTANRTKSSPRRKTAKPSIRQRAKRKPSRRGMPMNAAAESANRRHRRFVPGLYDDGRGARRVDRIRSSSPDGGERPRSTATPAPPTETAWENIDKDGSGGQSPWSDAEIAIRRRAGDEASFVGDDAAMHPLPSEGTHDGIRERHWENAGSTD